MHENDLDKIQIYFNYEIRNICNTTHSVNHESNNFILIKHPHFLDLWFKHSFLSSL